MSANNSLAHVSTIYSFLWSIVHGFQRDIRAWVLQKIESKLDSLRTEAAAFTERTRASARQTNWDSLQRYESHKVRAAALHLFRYGTGSDYANGILGA
jgi:DNA helicase II / ATP-dependent DNA helicase PcrA